MTRPLLWIVDHPLIAGTLMLLVTALLALQIPDLRIDTSTKAFTVGNSETRRYYDEFRRKFGSDTLTIVVVEADDVFTAEALGAVQRISDALARIAEVSRVESLTTSRNIKGEGDFVTTEPLVPAALPEDPSALAAIRADALASRVLSGSLVANDGKAAAILAYTDAGPVDGQFSRRLAERVDAIIDREAAPGLRLYQTGDHLADAVAGDFILEDLLTFVPISFVVMFLFLLAAFRSLQGMTIPMVTGFVSIVWALGLMAVAGLPLSILTAAVPSLLLVLGSAEDVHMLTEYQHLLEEGRTKPEAIRAMVRRAALPVLVTTLTTVFGFGSMILTDIGMLIQFGYASALALTANLVVTLATLPPMLCLFPAPRKRRPPASGESGHGVLPRLMVRLGHFDLRHRAAIGIGCLVLAVVSVVGWYSLRVDTDPVGFFPRASVIRQRLAAYEAVFGGSNAFSIVIERGAADGVKDPQLLRKIAALQQFLADTGEVDKSVSIADYLMKMHREMHGGDPAFETVPDTARQVAQYLLLLEGPEVSKYLDFNASAANIVVRHRAAGTWNLTALLGKIDAYARTAFGPGVTVRYTGEAILVRDAADSMAVNELTSFSQTFGIIALIHSWLFRSLWIGFFSMLPDAIPALFTFGLMGALGIPLNPGTAMIASIALGIAVDDTVHHMITYERQLRDQGDRKAAMLATIRAQGRPVIYVSAAVAAGFFVLGFSRFVPLVHFGILSGVVMLFAMASELLVTPVVAYSIFGGGASAWRRRLGWPLAGRDMSSPGGA